MLNHIKSCLIKCGVLAWCEERHFLAKILVLPVVLTLENTLLWVNLQGSQNVPVSVWGQVPRGVPAHVTLGAGISSSCSSLEKEKPYDLILRRALPLLAPPLRATSGRGRSFLHLPNPKPSSSWHEDTTVLFCTPRGSSGSVPQADEAQAKCLGPFTTLITS